MRAEIQLNSLSSFRVGFEGIVGADDKTDIALDDISFSTGCYKVSRSNNWGSNAMKVGSGEEKWFAGTCNDKSESRVAHNFSKMTIIQFPGPSEELTENFSNDDGKGVDNFTRQ